MLQLQLFVCLNCVVDVCCKSKRQTPGAFIVKVFNCVCEFGHTFEGWFDSVESLDEQIEKKWVACPYCETTNVKRVPSAAHVRGFRDQERYDAQENLDEREAIVRMRAKAVSAARRLLKDSEDVGERFAEEARAVHQGKAPLRTIHGKCTLNDAQDLLEEGIGVLPIPDGVIHTKN